MNVFPSIPGYVWPPTLAPDWAGIVQKTVTGRVVAATYQQYPRYKFAVKFDVLHQADYETLVGFFNQQQGNVVPFLFDAGPGNDTVNLYQYLGTGTGSLNTYTLLRGFNGFVEPIAAPNTYAIFWERYGFLPEILSDGSFLRENLAKGSQTFTAEWSIGNLSATTGQTAPDATTTATEFADTTSNSLHFLQQSGIPITADYQYTFSVFLKAGTHQHVELIFDNGATNGVYASFDLVNGRINGTGTGGAGSLSVGTGAMMQYAGNGWYRCSIAGTIDSTSTSARLSIVAMPNSTLQWFSSYAGTGTTFYAWGAQFELASHLNPLDPSVPSSNAYANPTAYIPTTTAAVSVSQDYSISGNQVTFNTAPPSGALVVWNGTYYFQCRFSKGTAEFDQFLYQIYKTKSVSLETYW